MWDDMMRASFRLLWYHATSKSFLFYPPDRARGGDVQTIAVGWRCRCPALAEHSNMIFNGAPYPIATDRCMAIAVVDLLAVGHGSGA